MSRSSGGRCCRRLHHHLLNHYHPSPSPSSTQSIGATETAPSSSSKGLILDLGEGFDFGFGGLLVSEKGGTVFGVENPTMATMEERRRRGRNGEVGGGMIACLSVPGDESTEVSLIIQNKGKGPLDVNISAPDFVRLDKPKVTIQENDDQKVMVSIGEGKTEKLITLKTLEGSCSLDFMDFLTHNPMKKSNYASQLTYTSLFRRTPFLGLLSLALILVIVSVVVCVTYQKRRFVNSGAKYQKLDAELPVSGGPKVDFDQKDGWDDNWSDDWGDVEAPSTPSMPLTPSISSAGVSSRRVNKDAWKD